jgi:hypothetical protein
VPIFFDPDPYQSDIEGFLAALASSSFWTTTTAEYGAQSPTIEPSILISTAPPQSTDTKAIGAWIASLADGTHAGWPKADADHIFTVFYPSTTTVTFQNLTSCASQNGYLGVHDEAVLADNVTRFPIAVLPRCPQYGSLPITGVDEVTTVTSHELIEAATDPFGLSKPAYRYADAAHSAWETFSDEDADWCTMLDLEAVLQIGGKYWVQRSWSNASALALHNPCVPAPAHSYFFASPVLENVQASNDAGAFTTTGLVIPAGTSRTVDVRLYADGPVTGVTLRASPRASPALTFSWDRTPTGNPGDVFRLTIKAGALPGGFHPMAIWSELGNASNPYVFMVSNGP